MGRELLRTDLVWAHEQFWGDEQSHGRRPIMPPTPIWGPYERLFSCSLHPTTDVQKQLLGAAAGYSTMDRSAKRAC